MTRSDFAGVYADSLRAAIKADPEGYGLDALDRVPVTIGRMMTALDAGTANVTGSDALRILARRLGIRHTVRDITAFFAALTEG
jgi:hypothetical protein